MKNYIEDKYGSLTIGNMSIPANESNRHYRLALQEVEEGTATIEYWDGSQRQADYNEAKALSDWKTSRAAAVDAITVEVDGLIFDGDEISQNRMARAVSASSSEDETTTWVLVGNTAATVTAGQLKRALKLAGTAQTNVWVR